MGVRVVRRRGRFVEESNFELYIDDRLVAVGKIFAGRPPYWGPWAEFYLLTGPSTEAEEAFRAIASELGWRGHIMVYYSNHPDIFKAVEAGVDVRETWLGRLMESVGCRPTKVWYFPEGGLEGDVKIQCEFKGQVP